MGAGGGREESHSEESHSAVEMPAIVRGSKVPATGAVGCQPGRDVAVRCKRIQRVGSGRRKARQTTEKYAHGGRRRGHSFSHANCTDPATQERVQYQGAGPPGQLLHR